MAQYTPYNDLSSFPEIDRKLTQKELDRVINFANKLGIEGYIQSLESASSEFIPDFDGTGIWPHLSNIMQMGPYFNYID